jgi:hypothetical protein
MYVGEGEECARRPNVHTCRDNQTRGTNLGDERGHTCGKVPVFLTKEEHLEFLAFKESRENMKRDRRMKQLTQVVLERVGQAQT